MAPRLIPKEFSIKISDYLVHGCAAIAQYPSDQGEQRVVSPAATILESPKQMGYSPDQNGSLSNSDRDVATIRQP